MADNPLIEALHDAPTQAPRRIMLYGVHGIGKTTFATNAPNPVFIPTEDGVFQFDVPKFDIARSFEAVMNNLRMLYAHPHDRNTVVIDTLDWLEKLVNDLTVSTKGKGKDNIEDFGYGKGFVFAQKYWRELTNALDALRTNRNMGILLIAHADIKKFDDPLTESYDRYQPALHKLAAAHIMQWCDEVLFTNYKSYIKTDKNTEKKRGLGDGERVMYTSERPAAQAKNRLGMPDVMPFDWKAYAEYAKVYWPDCAPERESAELSGGAN